MKKSLFGLAALVAAGGAQASIIPTLTGDPTDVGGGVFEYIYTATLASDQALFEGSYFTLYDVRGFSGFGALPANWAGTAQALGITPVNVLPNDDPVFTNVTFTYSGPTVNYSEDPAENIERELGSFSVLSTVGTFGLDDFTSEAVRNSGAARGTLVATIGQDAVAIPGAGPGTPVIPEPGTWAMLIVGFGLIGAATRGQRRQATAVRA